MKMWRIIILTVLLLPTVTALGKIYFIDRPAGSSNGTGGGNTTIYNNYTIINGTAGGVVGVAGVIVDSDPWSAGGYTNETNITITMDYNTSPTGFPYITTSGTGNISLYIPRANRATGQYGFVSPQNIDKLANLNSSPWVFRDLGIFVYDRYTLPNALFPYPTGTLIGRDATDASMITSSWWHEIYGNLAINNKYADGTKPYLSTDGYYDVSVQSNDSDVWLEFLNQNGPDQGAFFGLYADDFQIWNYQGGDIIFYTNPTARGGVERFKIGKDGTVTIQENVSIGTSTSNADLTIRADTGAGLNVVGYSTTGHVGAFVQNANSSTNSALNVASVNRLFSGMQTTCQNNEYGCFKVDHQNPDAAADSTAYTFSVETTGATTAAGGLYMNMWNSTGKPVLVRNTTGTVWEMYNTGQVVQNSDASSCFLVQKVDGTDRFRIDCDVGLTRSGKHIPLSTSAYDLGDNTLQWRSLALSDNITFGGTYKLEYNSTSGKFLFYEDIASYDTNPSMDFYESGSGQRMTFIMTGGAFYFQNATSGTDNIWSYAGSNNSFRIHKDIQAEKNMTITGQIVMNGSTVCTRDNGLCTGGTSRDYYPNITNLQNVENFTTNRPLIYGNTTMLNLTKGGTGNCGVGTVVHNVTTTGVQCIADSTGSGGGWPQASPNITYWNITTAETVVTGTAPATAAWTTALSLYYTGKKNFTIECIGFANSSFTSNGIYWRANTTETSLHVGAIQTSVGPTSINNAFSGASNASTSLTTTAVGATNSRYRMWYTGEFESVASGVLTLELGTEANKTTSPRGTIYCKGWDK